MGCCVSICTSSNDDDDIEDQEYPISDGEAESARDTTITISQPTLVREEIIVKERKERDVNSSDMQVNESGSGEECQEELEEAPEDQNKTEQEVNTSNIQVTELLEDQNRTNQEVNTSDMQETETGSEEECQEELQELLEDENKREQEVNTSDMQETESGSEEVYREELQEVLEDQTEDERETDRGNETNRLYGKVPNDEVQPSIKSSIDGAEETEGYNEQEHLTEDLPIAAATENEQVRAALTLPHPRLWQEFQRLAAALSTNERGVRVCGEDYVWRENVKWKNPTPSARRSARYFTNMDEGLDVTLIVFDTVLFVVLSDDNEDEGQRLSSNDGETLWVRALLLSEIALPTRGGDYGDDCWCLEGKQFRYRFKSRYDHSKQTACAILQSLSFLRRKALRVRYE